MHLFFYYVNNTNMKKILIIMCFLFCNRVYASEEVYLTNLLIEGYNINFEISDEDNLIIDYELSNDNGYVLVSGNGNFNKSENIIVINVNNEYEYKIHALKTLNVSKVENDNPKEYSSIKKEIAKFIIITISCISVFLFYYLMFNKKYYFHI